MNPTIHRLRPLLGLACVVLLVGGFAVVIPGVFSSPCANDILIESVSPGGRVKAVTFRRNCGATTGYSIHVSILAASARLPNEAGNVFVARDEPAIHVGWVDDRHLSISGDRAAPVFLRVSDFADIHITYD